MLNKDKAGSPLPFPCPMAVNFFFLNSTEKHQNPYTFHSLDISVHGDGDVGGGGFCD